MKENLLELNARGLGKRWPILLGGAALTRPFVEDDLASLFDGEVRYARDAFEGLALMEPLVAIARGAAPDSVGLPPLKKRITARSTLEADGAGEHARAVRCGRRQPDPELRRSGAPGSSNGIALHDYAAFLDERATFMGQWGSSPVAARTARPTRSSWRRRAGRDCGTGSIASSRRASWMRRWSTGTSRSTPRATTWSCCITGTTLPVRSAPPDSSHPTAARAARRAPSACGSPFPRQRRDRHLCLADYVRSKKSGQTDVVAVQLVTAGSAVDTVTAKLFAEDKYRDYLELNGLTMQLTEALAEYWHSRVRAELGFGAEDPEDIAGMFKLQYRGARFSLGYPACPNMEDRRKGGRAAQARADGCGAVGGAAAAS